jgi:predicted PurR-regulated permease PerM
VDRPSSEPSGFALARRALPLITLCVAVVVAVVLFWYLIDVVLLAFAGVLLAILLRTPADWLARHSRLPETWALALVVVAVAALLGFAGWFFGHTLSQQFSTLVERLPDMLSRLRDRFSEYDWIVGGLEPTDLLTGQGAGINRGINAVLATFGALGNVVIVFFTGLFLAIQPRIYVRGMLQLVPLAQRERAREVVKSIGDTLRRWLIGQVFMMAVIGGISGAGLALLGVPLAFALGLITGMLEFIPYVGPILAGALALVVAIAESPELGLYVILLYLGIHALEGYVLEPIVQQRAVYLPPATLLLAQVILGILVGVLGVMLATPLAAALLVMVRMLYVHDVLGAPVASRK